MYGIPFVCSDDSESTPADLEMAESWAAAVAAEETAEEAKKLLEGVQLTIFDFLAKIERDLAALNGGVR